MSVQLSNETVAEVTAELGFSRPQELVEDNAGRGLKRAVTRPIDYQFDKQFENVKCRVRDWSAPGQAAPNLQTMGFEALNLSGNAKLQALLGQMRSSGEITPEQARALRRQLNGSVYPLASGKCLKLLHVAPEGLIMRKGGPNGLKIDPDVEMSEMNGHDVALAVHGDQDVRGTPLKQIMRGFAPWMFRHQTPDGSNRVSPLVLVNLWIPLQQATRPLALMDRRTLKAREHQLRYALPTDTFLDRRQDMRFNDIWAFLHDEGQQWYFNGAMGHDQAYVFDTLGEPHTSMILPGEEVAEHYYCLLQRQCRQLARGEPVERAVASPQPMPGDTTVPLRHAINTLAELAASAPTDRSDSDIADAWCAATGQAMESVVRKSLEMRVVAVLTPNIWPFNRAMTASADGSGGGGSTGV
jgi:hypothetical protein